MGDLSELLGIDLDGLTLDEVLDVIGDLPDHVAISLLEHIDTVTDRARSVADLLPHQRPPEGEDWNGWVMLGGRGAGKTYAASRFLADLARSTPGLRARIIAPTLGDAVNGVVRDPDSGILAYDSEAVYKSGGPEGSRVEWPNGSTIWCIGTPTLRDVDRLRALTNIDVDHFEEAAANPMLAEAAEQAALSRRGKRLTRPRWIATTTPRPLPTIKGWLKSLGVVTSRARMFDNPHTPEAYTDYARALEGTRQYRQEVLGEVLEDVEGALWTQNDIDRSLVPIDERDAILELCTRRVVGVDPPSGPGTCGIVVLGATAAGKIYVLDDYSLTDASPNEWAQAAAQAARDYDALVVAEVNQGGRMVTSVLKEADAGLPVTTVHAADGKKARAEPIAVLWEATEQGAGMAPATPTAFLKLIDQMTGWVPGTYSPDHLDAMVWAATHLRKGSGVAVARAVSSAIHSPVSGGLSALRQRSRG